VHLPTPATQMFPAGGCTTDSRTSGGLSSRGHRAHSRYGNATAQRKVQTRSAPRMTYGDTIFALSSGAGVTAGVAVIRVSGSSATATAQKLFKDPSLLPAPRVAALRRLYHPDSRDLLDHALVLHFPAPRSFTGDDVVELHAHGSRAVVAAVLDALAAAGARPAERGEFTRRAFENGRMDLTEVEGLADLIAADTDEQRRQALRQLRGEVRQTYEAWRAEIKGCLAHTEAVIDFGDDVDDGAFEAVLPRVEELHTQMKRQLSDDRRGEIVRGGIQVAIVGPPNVGKSTLLNLLAGRPAAIVSPHAGTTRDIVEVRLDLNGIPVVVRDTAGLHEDTRDEVELEGMRRAREVAASADITILVQDASELAFSKNKPKRGLTVDVLEEEGTTPAVAVKRSTAPSLPRACLVIANKTDLIPVKLAPEAPDDNVFYTSFASGEGVDSLVEALEAIVRRRLEGSVDPNDGDLHLKETREPPLITRVRHRYHVERAVEALEAFISGRSGPVRGHYLPMDLAAEELRIASRELGAITGIIHVEEVLDVIFNDFCIGK
jgi:tRNA modification GTPase